jgi:hypothetical protein
MGRLHRGEFRPSRQGVSTFWTHNLQARKPYLDDGLHQVWARELRVPGALLGTAGDRHTTALAAPSASLGLVHSSPCASATGS